MGGAAERAAQLQMFGLPTPVQERPERPLVRLTDPGIPHLGPPLYPAQFRPDPRPDLAEDHELWVRLLRSAEKSDQALQGALHGFRAAGCLLVRNERGAYVIRPLIDPENGWASQDEYEEAKRTWLMPHVGQIAKLLQAL